MTMTARRNVRDKRAYCGPLTAGVGCTSGATADEIISLIHTTLDMSRFEAGQLVGIATHIRKQAFLPLHQAALHFGVPLVLLDDAELPNVVPTPSDFVAKSIGLPGLAEAAAAAAGTLLVPKHKSAQATCALGAGALNGVGQLSSFSAAMASSTLATSSAGP